MTVALRRSRQSALSVFPTSRDTRDPAIFSPRCLAGSPRFFAPVTGALLAPVGLS
jgi:hypothetical protein